MVLDLYTREAIGYRYGRTGSAIGRVSRVIVHHWYLPDVPASATPAEERSYCRGVEHYHAITQGWSAAPGYQWMVADSGRVYEGVGWGRTGVHTAGYNSSSVGISFMNNGDEAQPTAKAWQAIYELVRWGVRRGSISSSYTLNGHRQFAPKSCPGNKTWANINKVRTGVALPEPIPEPEEFDEMRQGDEGKQVLILRYYVGKLLGQDLGDNTRYTDDLGVKVGDAHERLGFRRVEDVACGIFQAALWFEVAGHRIRLETATNRNAKQNERLQAIERSHRMPGEEFATEHVPHIHDVHDVLAMHSGDPMAVHVPAIDPMATGTGNE
jgi:hypothetical protein